MTIRAWRSRRRYRHEVPGEHPHHLDPPRDRDENLDVLWVSTVAPADLIPPPVDPLDTVPYVAHAANRHDRRPVHGTISVDVRHHRDRALLERLLNGGRVLSVTAADGWSQRVRLVALRQVRTEAGADGDHQVVATYHWVAASACN